MRKAITHLKKSDPILARIIERIGPYRIEFLEPVFETLVQSIVYQQLSGKAAQTIFGRLAAAVQTNGCLTPEAILKMRSSRMRSLGLSRQKIAYIRDLAMKTRSGEVDFSSLPSLPDEEVVSHLTRIKGIGIWTAQMFLIFALRRLNVLPSSDLGVRVAIQKAYDFPTLPSVAEIERLAESWQPYCTVASWYLWRSLESKAGL
jgi:DNA-3-methyladenine glycosylase II